MLSRTSVRKANRAARSAGVCYAGRGISRASKPALYLRRFQPRSRRGHRGYFFLALVLNTVLQESTHTDSFLLIAVFIITVGCSCRGARLYPFRTRAEPLFWGRRTWCSYGIKIAAVFGLHCIKCPLRYTSILTVGVFPLPHPKLRAPARCMYPLQSRRHGPYFPSIMWSLLFDRTNYFVPGIQYQVPGTGICVVGTK